MANFVAIHSRMFLYNQYKPSPQLAGLVECYWAMQSDGRFLQTPDRLVPGGRVELMFNFGDNVEWLLNEKTGSGQTMPSAFIMGQRDKIFYAKGNGRADMVGLRFKPGGLASFTKIPVSSLLNSVVAAEDIFGRQAAGWADMLFEQPSIAKKIERLEALLLQALKHPQADEPLVQYAVDALRNGGTSIKDVCDNTGFYYKKLERLFLKTAGYTPKHYAKITRFNKALRLMQGSESLTGICYECNYFDQSHFIKDFYELAGTSPKQFRKEDNKIASLLIRHQAV